MKERIDIAKKVEETLNSLDGLIRAEASPFLFTRIQARLENRPASWLERLISVASKPSMAFAVVIIVLLANLGILMNQSQSQQITPDQPQFAVADEFDMQASTLYEDETPEP